MIICPKCGNDNPLGRVFCGKCGSKLDFSHTSSQEMAAKNKVSWFSEHGKKVVYLVVIILLIPVGLAFWPKTGVVGKPPSDSGEKKVENGVKAVAAVKKGQVVSAAFAEEDLNAYFQRIKAGAWGFESVSVASMQGFFSVRAVAPLLPKIAKIPFTLKVSYDIVCVPVSGGNMTVPKVTVGHLPMPGIMKSKVINVIRRKVTSDKDWAPFNNITDIKAENGRLSVTIKP